MQQTAELGLRVVGGGGGGGGEVLDEKILIVFHLSGTELYGGRRVDLRHKFTHIDGEVDAAELVARRTEVRILDEVEDDHQNEQEDDHERHRDADEDAFPAGVPLAKRDVRKKDDGAEPAED